MRELRSILNAHIKNLVGEDFIDHFNNLNYVYPFNSPECHKMEYLIGRGVLSYEECLELKRKYSERNKYLNLFEMAPRTFGQSWGETHILNMFPRFIKATKENLITSCPKFDGEFDLWIDGIRVEVKSCRANSTTTRGSLSDRAYLHSEAKSASFKYHYQQLKPSCCDVFIWIGVCRDELLYWVITSEELKNTGKLGTQHRNENTGVGGVEVFEGQVFMTEEELEPYKVLPASILDVVIQKGRNC